MDVRDLVSRYKKEREKYSDLLEDAQADVSRFAQIPGQGVIDTREDEIKALERIVAELDHLIARYSESE